MNTPAPSYPNGGSDNLTYRDNAEINMREVEQELELLAALTGPPMSHRLSSEAAAKLQLARQATRRALESVRKAKFDPATAQVGAGGRWTPAAVGVLMLLLAGAIRIIMIPVVCP